MTTRRRTLITLAAALAALGPQAALAQGYPERPVKLVVPFAPGGSADIAARLLADDWGKLLGKTVFIENKAGAGGNIGVDAVAKAAPDGYTIGLQTVSLAINPALYPKMPYDTLKDLAPVVEKLNVTLNQALAGAALKERMTKEGMDPLPASPAQARQRLTAELPQWGRLVKDRGISVE